MSEHTDDDVVVDPADEAAEAEAIAAAMAGYQTRAKAPVDIEPAPAPPEAVEQPQVEGAGTSAADVSADPPQPPEVPNLLDDEPDPAPAPEPTLAQALTELRELKAAVKNAGGDPDAIRKLHGEIGAINRTLQQLSKPQAAPTAKPATAPVDDELTAAINKAKTVADNYPDIGGPLVEALEATAKRTATAAPAMSADEISALVSEQAKQAAQAAAAKENERLAQQALAEEHPDWHVVRATPAFQKWFAAQPQEYRARVENTWNPVVVANSLTTFKAELKRQQDERARKQERLAGAVTPPRGDAAKAQKSTIPDEEAALIGYQSVKRHNSPTQVKR